MYGVCIPRDENNCEQNRQPKIQLLKSYKKFIECLLYDVYSGMYVMFGILCLKNITDG